MTIEILLNRIYTDKSHMYFIPYEEYAIFARQLEYIFGYDEDDNRIEIHCAYPIFPYNDENSHTNKDSLRTVEYEYHILNFVTSDYMIINPVDLLKLIIAEDTILKDRWEREIHISDRLRLATQWLIEYWKKVPSINDNKEDNNEI